LDGPETDEMIYVSYFQKTIGPMKDWTPNNFVVFSAIRSHFMEHLTEARRAGKITFKWEEDGTGGMGPVDD
jgi:hypothetical protein